MANNFDELPLYDAIIKTGTPLLSDVWRDSLATLFQTLITYLSQNGIFLPNLTTTQINSIPSPALGQMVYNTTLGTAQYFKAGVWTSF